MFYTARQLDDMFKTHGRVVLPYRARLSPLAKDWVKHRGVAVGYGDGPLVTSCDSCCDAPATNGSASAKAPAAAAATTAVKFVWWCDGPCGAARAALLGMAKEVSLNELGVAMEAKQIVAAVKALAGEVKAGRVTGGVIAVNNGAEGVVYANHCPSLRAILGTSLQTVDAGVQAVAANVLVIEHPGKTLQQVRNLLSRFVRGRRELSEELRQRLADLATC